MSSRQTFRALRSATAVNTVLIAATASAVFVGSYGLFGGETTTETRDGAAASSSAKGAAELAPFTTADAGACLNWDIDAQGKVSNFSQTDCSTEHRFEVAAREDLSVYPTSEFGENAEMPNQERQAQLREELCHGATLAYVDGRFDPAGKFSIAPILPPAEAWAQGDRTMLCGLQTTDENGVAQQFSGRVVEVDQANIAEAGACRAIGDDQVLRTVDCAEPHQLETVSIVDLSRQFPQGTPSIDDQNTFLSERCTQAVEDYLGGEEALYQSTLQPYWGSLAESSWNGGSRSVNCSLMHVNGQTKTFSAITGSAKNGRESLTIDGATPAAPLTRNPLRNP